MKRKAVIRLKTGDITYDGDDVKYPDDAMETTIAPLAAQGLTDIRLHWLVNTMRHTPDVLRFEAEMIARRVGGRVVEIDDFQDPPEGEHIIYG
ncbi:MAG: hypothetical protein ACPG7F_00420 [Aggregatilineales bacterium]